MPRGSQTRPPDTAAVRRGAGLRRMPDVLGKVLDPAARRRGLAAATLLTEWATVVGTQLAAQCQPVQLVGGRSGQGGVLHVHVNGPAALEIQHSEPQLIERINDHLGYAAVARLRLVQAPLAPPAPKPARLRLQPPDPREQAEVDAAVSSIDDQALHTALWSLGMTLKSRRDLPAAKRKNSFS